LPYNPRVNTQSTPSAVSRSKNKQVYVGEIRFNAYRVLVGKPEVEGAIGRPRHRWEADIRMEIKTCGYTNVD